jgi:CBS domain-containing protein
MFQVYSVAGLVFNGSLEQLRKVAPASAVARARAIALVDSEPLEPHTAHPGQNPQATTNDARPGVLAAYASTAHGGNERRPLTRVADVMSKLVLTVPLDANVLQAWQSLTQKGYGQAPVVDGHGTLVGLFLRADLMRTDLLERTATDAPAWRALLAQPVRSLMWTPVPATSPDTELRRVATVLLDTGLPGLPVTDERGTVTGFISRSDILRAVTADPPLDLWG